MSFRPKDQEDVRPVVLPRVHMPWLLVSSTGAPNLSALLKSALHKKTLPSKVYRLFGHNCATFVEWLLADHGLTCNIIGPALEPGKKLTDPLFTLSLPWDCRCRVNEQLETLHRKGVISEEEYQKRKMHAISDCYRVLPDNSRDIVSRYLEATSDEAFDRSSLPKLLSKMKRYEVSYLYAVALVPNLLHTHACFLMVTTDGNWYSFGGYPMSRSVEAVTGMQMIVKCPDPALSPASVSSTDLEYTRVVAEFHLEENRRLTEQLHRKLTTLLGD